jgi:hypothetical protein
MSKPEEFVSAAAAAVSAAWQVAVRSECNKVFHATRMRSIEGSRMPLGIVPLVCTSDTVDRRVGLSLGIQRTIGGWR